MKEVTLNVEAYDLEGNVFNKQIETIIQKNEKAIVQLDFMASYSLSDMVDRVKEQPTADLCIDLGGRNHKNSPVFIRNHDLKNLLIKAESIQ